MKYLSLVKPGILVGNGVTLLGGYFLAIHGWNQSFSGVLLLLVLLGMSLVIASGCVLNNFIDRDIDVLMRRTCHRPSVLGLVSLRQGLWYAGFLGVSGFVILYWWVRPIAAYAALFGFCIYVLAYSLWFKRHSVWGTAIGGVAGAMPPVVGYCAVTGLIDSGALWIFALLFCWQIPHSYAIAIYRKLDYEAASIPVLPVRSGIVVTKAWMLFFVVACAVSAFMLFFIGMMGTVYLALSMLASVVWCGFSVWGYWVVDEVRWARRMFLMSIAFINVLCIAIVLG